MSDDLSGASLQELFRAEVTAHAETLGKGLLAAERTPDDPALLEMLMRAAHSIKGAARIVSAQAAVDLAHAVEDCFVAAQRGRFRLESASIDVLLQATDVLLEMAAVPLESAADAPAHPTLVRDLRRLLEGHGPAPRAVASTPVPAPAPAPAPLPRPAPRAEPTVRVAAKHIDRWMGLAGDAVIEASRLHEVSTQWSRYRSRESALMRAIDHLAQRLVATADRETATLLHEARMAAQECRNLAKKQREDVDELARRAEELSRRMHGEALASRMRPFSDGVTAFPRMVRDLARRLGKEVDLVIAGEEVRVDRDILEKVESPLNHLLRNAVDHGLETPEERRARGKPERGRLRLEARHSAGLLSIVIADDGRGIDVGAVRLAVVARALASSDEVERMSDAEVIDHIFVPGFSTAGRVSEVSGRGVGLDVVKSVLGEIGGSVRVISAPGEGARFELLLPVTLSVIRAVLVDIAGEPYALPVPRIDRLAKVPLSEVGTLEGRPYFKLEDRHLALVPARQVLGLGGEPAEADPLCVVVIGDRRLQIGVIVDNYLGEHDLVVQPLDARLGRVPDVSAAAIGADGAPLTILDVEELCASSQRLLHEGHAARLGPAAPRPPRQKKRILVCDDSITVREVQRQLLRSHGFDVQVATDGMEGLQIARAGDLDLVITDVEMPRMNGIELVRSIKSSPKLSSLPVIIVSYKDRPEDRSRGLEAGANYYLAKSDFHDEALLGAVTELIGEAEK